MKIMLDFLYYLIQQMYIWCKSIPRAEVISRLHENEIIVDGSLANPTYDLYLIHPFGLSRFP